MKNFLRFFFFLAALITTHAQTIYRLDGNDVITAPFFTDANKGVIDSSMGISAARNALAPAQALVFDGTSGCAFTVAGPGTGALSVFATANPSALSGVQMIVGGGASAFGLYVNSSGYLVSTLIGVGDNTPSTTAIAAGVPSCVGYTRTGTTGTYWVNGASAGTTTDSRNYATAYTEIGKASGTYNFIGTLRPIGILNRALSAAEVKTLYQTGSVARADINNASNTSLITGDNSTFASDTGYWTKTGVPTISGGLLTAPSAADYVSHAALFTVGKKYRLTAGAITGQMQISDGVTPYTLVSGGSIEITAQGTDLNIGTNATGTLDSITLYPLGALIAPEANAPGNGLVWNDVSGNAANITLPATGVSWSLPTSGKAFSLSLASTTAGASGAGALVVAGGISAGNTGSAASYFGGALNVAGALGASSLTSPAATNLTLGLGTGGTALTLASSTLAATFAGAVTVSSTTAGSSGAGALVVQGGISAGNTGSAASYFGGALNVAGAATFAGAVTATGGTFSGYITGGANSDTLRTGSQIYISNTEQVGLRVGIDNSFNLDTYNGYSNLNALKILQNGNATFAGAVTATLGTTLPPQAAPASPASGWTLYTDSGDGNKLKAKASNGTVVTLGTP